ncbi:unnamed protein product [Lactuca saligna]|uniref:Xylanase inhibitor N-terminal domain-containing protein n=1 Tax=Lactuca saligna TaxID=75948 RepID=A0AA35YDJ9_LACSI|nr:unnamed protein product [Lactuca saligna]
MVSSTVLCLVLLQAVGALGFPATLKLERSFPTNHGVELKQLTERDGLRHHRILHKYADPNVVVGFEAVGALGFPATLKLERSFPTNHGVELKQLTERDGLRHHRILHKYADPNVVVGFEVYGTYDPFDAGFLLLSMIQQTRQHLLLSYARTKDVLQNPTHVQITNAPTISTKGCSTSETGQISQTERTLDEIMGLGRQIISVISQISSQGIAPNSFGHCLAGGDGGGILAFGTPVMPDLVFTPLVKSM